LNPCQPCRQGQRRTGLSEKRLLVVLGKGGVLGNWPLAPKVRADKELAVVCDEAAV